MPSANLKVKTLTRPKLKIAPTKTADPYGKFVLPVENVLCRLEPKRHLSGHVFLARLLKVDEITCILKPVDCFWLFGADRWTARGLVQTMLPSAQFFPDHFEQIKAHVRQQQVNPDANCKNQLYRNCQRHWLRLGRPNQIGYIHST